MNKFCWGIAVAIAAAFLFPVNASAHDDLVAVGYNESPMGRPIIFYELYTLEDQIKEEIRNGEKEELAQLIEAEGGNQPLEGKRCIADVVLNRVADPAFPDTIHEVIFQKGQFAVVENGAFNKAAWHMQQSDYEAVELEMEMGEQLDYDIVFFSRGKASYGTNWYKVGAHWFGERKES